MKINIVTSKRKEYKLDFFYFGRNEKSFHTFLEMLYGLFANIWTEIAKICEWIRDSREEVNHVCNFIGTGEHLICLGFCKGHKDSLL